MREICRSSDTALLGLYQSILDDAGIPHYVRNDATQQAILRAITVVFLPLPDFLPTLCVLHDDDYPEAMTLLQKAREAPTGAAEDWICTACGESVPGNFTSCWKCETEPKLPGA